MGTPLLLQWTSAARSDVGPVRERNEDAWLERPERGLWAVADGMGGHAVGDYASRAIVEALDALPAAASLEAFASSARARLQAVNQALRTEAASRQVRRIGSTVVVMLACGERCTCLWAGDSRAYLLRAGRLLQLTRDHSQAEELRARGPIAEELIPQLARNTITRAVGATAVLDLDETSVDVQDGDVFLLCSDGLSNPLMADEIASLLAGGNCRQAAEALIARALERGARDNVTVVVARAEDLYSSDKTQVNPDL